MPGTITALPPAPDRTLVSAVWPLLLIMALMLMLSLFSVLVVSGLRAYTYGQARWSIGENQAIEQLRRYAVDGDEASYQRFLESLAVPLGDRVARLQLQRPYPDYALARRGLLAGGNAPADISALIVIFRLFDHLPLMAHAVAVWGAADTFIGGEQDAGELLHAQFAGAHPDRRQIGALLVRVDDLHRRVVPVAEEFGATIGLASRQIGQLLLWVLPLGCALLLAAGVSRSRALFRRDERMAEALRDLTSSLRHQATHDSLTNLTNRAAFDALLATAIAERVRGEAHWWLLYFDLDQFKVINDTCGHAAGDELIQKVSWLLRARLQPDDMLARLGGDEFGVLLPRRTREAALALADDIRQQISGLRFQFTNRMFAVSASLGMLALDDTVASVGDALSRADQACYLAKDNGRNRVQIYHPDDRQVQVRHGEMQWVERLHAALDEDRFAVVAQEIRPVGAQLARGGQLPAQRFEMLLRMVGPDGELIAPMAFIPAAERYGLMPRVDRWVIARVCRELAQLRGRGQPLPTCMVNLSGTSVCDPGLADFIAECLSQCNLRGMYLGFELTETAAVANLTQASQLMSRLRAMGCLIALDDFGSGMSSFAYLRNLPIDFLKIDGSFIRKIDSDPIDFAMVETIHRIGGIMGMQTVAESVENDKVLAALALIGVDFAQGFHIRRPVPLEQLQLTALPQQPRRDVVPALKAVVGPGAPGSLTGMGRIPQSFIDELIERTNIVEVIGLRVPLKKAGREYRACCPFHNEKTPSFWVSPEKQFYHCFGCGAHGTALGFLIEHDRLPFPEAVEELAQGLGLTVPHEGGAAPPPKRNESLFDLMEKVAHFYATTLEGNPRAREYLAGRGLQPQTLQQFCIGYAPDSWNEVLHRFGASDEARLQLSECGLIIERDGAAPTPRSGERYYDRFRDRIMFPIRDARGRVIAFGGRVLDKGEPKYLNSPETVLFHKGRELYGLYETRQSRAPLNRLLVVEGYMDVVRLHQAGVHYAVATLGTATTADHLKRVFQLVSEVVFSFDGDRAGRAAAWRALQNALPEAIEGRELRFLFLPDGEDPDTLVGKEGREAFEHRLTIEALPLSEYFVRELGERVMTRGADGRAKVAQAARPLLLQVPEGVYRRLLTERLAQAFGFQRTPEGIAELLGIRIGASMPAAQSAQGGVGRGSLVRQAVRLLLHFPQVAADIPEQRLQRIRALEEPGIEVLSALIDELRITPAQSTAQVLERWRGRPGEPHLAKLAGLEAMVKDAAAAQRELDEALGRLYQESVRRQLDQLLEKDRNAGLSKEEKLELQQLMLELARQP